MKFSADYPGAMAKGVEAETGAPCLFLQGAAGDLSANPPEGVKGPEAFGKRLAADVLKLIGTIRIDRTKVKDSELVATREEMKFRVRCGPLEPANPFALGKAFFPELIGFFVKEYKDGVRPTITVALLDQLARISSAFQGRCSASTPCAPPPRPAAASLRDGLLQRLSAVFPDDPGRGGGGLWHGPARGERGNWRRRETRRPGAHLALSTSRETRRREVSVISRVSRATKADSSRRPAPSPASSGTAAGTCRP